MRIGLGAAVGACFWLYAWAFGRRAIAEGRTGAMRAVRLERDLAAAGFGDIRVEERPEWHQTEPHLWEAALAAPTADDASLRSLRTKQRGSYRS